MKRHEMAMPMPGELPDLDINKIEDQEIENGQEKETWAKEAWGVFVNKLDEYKNSDLAIGIKMYASDTVDFMKSKVEALSKSDRLSFFNFLAKEGNYIVGAKNDLMENISNNFSYYFKNEEMRRFFHNSAEIFKEEKEKNYDAVTKIENGEAKDLERIKGVGTGTGTLIKYTKLTVGATTPIGGVLMGTMAAGHLSEVAKKTRLQAEKVIEKTRVGQLDENGKLINEDDFDRAWDEAYRLYDEAVARSKDGEVSVKDLDKIYQENLPKDVLERIERNENYEGLNILQKGMILNMKNCAEKVEAEFLAIENSDKSAEEKEAGKQAIMERNKKLLQELDGMVSDQGIVDTYAYLARAGEKTGKAATLAVTSYLGVKGLHKAFESLKEINLDRLTENVMGLGRHFKEYAGKAYDIIGPNKLGAETLSEGHSSGEWKDIIRHIQERNPGKMPIQYSKEDLNRFVEARDGLKALESKSTELITDSKTLKLAPDVNASKNIANEKFNESINKYDTKTTGLKTVENPVKISGQVEKPTAHHFVVDETIKTKHGGSIWSQVRHNLENDEKFRSLSKELQVKNINLVEKHITADPKSFLSDDELKKLSKLGKEFDPKKMLAKEIDSVKMQKAFDETINDKGLILKSGEHHPDGHLKQTPHHHEKTKLPKAEMKAPGAKAVLITEAHKYTFVPEDKIQEGDFRFDNKVTIPKDSQFADEWKTWENRSADDFLHGKYGEAIVAPEPYKADGKLEWEKDIVFKHPDALEIAHRELLQERLQNAHDLIGDPKKGETVGQYIAEYNLRNADKNGELFNRLQDEGIIRGGASVKYQVINTIDKLPSEMKNQLLANFDANKNVALGYVKLFAGDRSGLYEGIKEMFSYQGEVNSADIHLNANGSITYENAFGKQGYDLIIFKDKVAVDGPGWNNWHIHGAKLNLENIRDAKAFVIGGKTMSDNIDELSKSEKLVSGVHEVAEHKAEVVSVGEEKKIISTEVIPKEKVDTGSRLNESVAKDMAKAKAEAAKIIDKTGTVSSDKDAPKINLEAKKNLPDADVRRVKVGSSVDKVVRPDADLRKNIESLESKIPAKDLKYFNKLVESYRKVDDLKLASELEKLQASNEKDKEVIVNAILKAMTERQSEDTSDFR